MDSDRELLELAAKAAGIKVPTKKDYPYAYINERGIHRDISCGGDGSRMSHWNPLTDDGDAFRLAVKLHLPVEAVIAFVAQREMEWEKDPYAATRRAIVRAAAEIGRSMA